MSLIDVMQKEASDKEKTIIFPEGEETNIILAARKLIDQQIAKPVLLTKNNAHIEKGKEINVSLEGIQIIDIMDENVITNTVNKFREINPETSEKVARNKLKDPLNFASIYTKLKLVDCMVAGIKYTTEEVILAAMTFIGLEDGISIPSSIFIMNIPNYNGSEGNILVFADCGVNVKPDAEGLADIAITSAMTAKKLLKWEPRVAFLSFSTKGSGYDDSIDKIHNAIRIVKEKDSKLLVDGELQADAALVGSVAKRKGIIESKVAGKANILIFPDINSGNIAYKLVQQLAGADAYGPFLQGFKRTVSDLSRGSSVDDILGVSIMCALHSS